MDILLKEVKQKFLKASSSIDDLISSYLTKRLALIILIQSTHLPMTREAPIMIA